MSVVWSEVWVAERADAFEVDMTHRSVLHRMTSVAGNIESMIVRNDEASIKSPWTLCLRHSSDGWSSHCSDTLRGVRVRVRGGILSYVFIRGWGSLSLSVRMHRVRIEVIWSFYPSFSKTWPTTWLDTLTILTDDVPRDECFRITTKLWSTQASRVAQNPWVYCMDPTQFFVVLQVKIRRASSLQG